MNLKSENEKEAKLGIEVIDTGIGIPKGRLDRLFKSFSQVDASTTDQPEPMDLPKNIQGKRILAVDDNDINCEIMSMI